MTKRELKNEIIKLIAELAPQGTDFRWSQSRTKFGTIRPILDKETGRLIGYRILISAALAQCNSWTIVRRQVLHEIAHVRTPGHKHDWVWIREFMHIGGDGYAEHTDIVPAPEPEAPVIRESGLSLSGDQGNLAA